MRWQSQFPQVVNKFHFVLDTDLSSRRKNRKYEGGKNKEKRGGETNNFGQQVKQRRKGSHLSWTLICIRLFHQCLILIGKIAWEFYPVVIVDKIPACPSITSFLIQNYPIHCFKNNSIETWVRIFLYLNFFSLQKFYGIKKGKNFVDSLRCSILYSPVLYAKTYILCGKRRKKKNIEF